MAKRLADIASPTLARSPTGGQGLVLDEKGRVRLDLLDVPRCRIYHNGNDEHSTTGTWEAAEFDTERYDPWGLFSTSVSVSQIIFPKAGIYHVGATVVWDTNATGSRFVRLYVNGATEIAVQGPITASASQPRFTISCDWEFAENDYVQVQGYQDSGGAVNMQSPEMWCHWIGAASGKVY